jgi:lipopolysaccharide heptosyltransferase I
VDPNRILIVKLGSIGDVVHTLPALASIKRSLPHSSLSWVVEKRASSILQDNPFIDDLIEVDTKALRRWPTSGETLLAPRQQFRRLRASSFDSALDFQGLIKSAAIARLSRAKSVFGFYKPALREPLSSLLLTRAVEVPLNTHVIRKNLALVRGALDLQISEDPKALEFPIAISRANEEEADRAAPSGAFAILNPGGGWVTKLWDPERFGALADELWTSFGLTSAVSFGPGEEELADRVIAASRSGKAKAVKVSLKGFVALAQRARIYIGGDTGPSHLAVAAGAPIVGIFGPTEWWRNGSPFPEDICVERNDIECRTDCHRRTCSNWICMDIGVERLVAAVEKRLAIAGNPKGELKRVGT